MSNTALYTLLTAELVSGLCVTANTWNSRTVPTVTRRRSGASRAPVGVAGAVSPVCPRTVPPGLARGYRTRGVVWASCVPAHTQVLFLWFNLRLRPSESETHLDPGVVWNF